MTNTSNETTTGPSATPHQRQHPAEPGQQAGNASGQNLSASTSAPTSAATDKHPERRLNPRIEVIPHSVDVTLLENGVHRGSGRICNISTHGMFVETNASFHNQEPHVKVQFRLPNSQHDFRTWGQVVHQTGNGIGVAADVLEPKTLASLQAVEHYVAQNAE
jgi:hypothetical protein